MAKSKESLKKIIDDKVAEYRTEKPKKRQLQIKLMVELNQVN